MADRNPETMQKETQKTYRECRTVVQKPIPGGSRQAENPGRKKVSVERKETRHPGSHPVVTADPDPETQ